MPASSSRQEIKTFVRNKTQASLKSFFEPASGPPAQNLKKRKKHSEELTDDHYLKSDSKRVKLTSVTDVSSSNSSGRMATSMDSSLYKSEPSTSGYIQPQKLTPDSTNDQPQDNTSDLTERSKSLITNVSVVCDLFYYSYCVLK